MTLRGYAAGKFNVKVRLSLADSEEEVRIVELPRGISTAFGDVMQLLEERFGRPLVRQPVYQDEQGDMITITTDPELKSAFGNGPLALKIFPAALADAAAGWEVVDLPEREAVEQL